jgi:hypothetical protein
MLQFYSEVKSLLSKAFPIKIYSEMPGTLEDFIQRCGAHNALFSDNVPEQCSKQVNKILCLYCINDMQCEPHHQHHNHAERCIQEVKKTTNATTDHTATPAKYWLLCLLFVIYLFNHLSTESIGGLFLVCRCLVYHNGLLLYILSIHWKGEIRKMGWSCRESR